jgi:hypothetical protein
MSIKTVSESLFDKIRDITFENQYANSRYENIIVIFKNNKVLKITITTRGGESKQTHSHRRDATQNRIIFDDGYNKGY